VSAGLILAAGESRRMGFRKLCCDTAKKRFSTGWRVSSPRAALPVIVVLGAEAERIRAGVRPAANFVVNPVWARGQTTSMQCGLRAVPPGADGVLFTLVDHRPSSPPPSMLCWPDRPHAAARAALPRAPRASYLVFPRDRFRILALPEDGAAARRGGGHAADTEFVDVEDPGIVADIGRSGSLPRTDGRGRMKIRLGTV